MLPRRHAFAVLLAAGCWHCSSDKDLLYEPVPIEVHDVKIAADAEGTPKAPAHVSIFLQRGVLHMTSGAEHTLEGVATSALGDAPPRLELMQDRVALTQVTVGGAAPKGDANFALALGKTPTLLEVETGTGEVQSIDLGGASIAKARLHTASGHLSIDWSAPNRLGGAEVVLKTEAGYIDVTHLGRSGASNVAVTDTSGYVSLDLGEVAAPLTAISASVTSGKLVVHVLAGTPARATIEAPADRVLLRGWTAAEAPFGFVTGDPAASPRVTVRVVVQGGSVELRAD
jgi:hypothetical protein